MGFHEVAAAPKTTSTPYFDERASKWLSYGSYVDEHRQILYVETPKAGCSSIKYTLRALVAGEDLQFNACARESRLAMLIHDRAQVPLPPLTAFSGEQLQNIMTDSAWFRFCVIRHPYDRFFSAWRDKVFLCEPGFESYTPQDGKKFVEFADFIARVMAEDDPFGCDPHWRAQVALLLPDDIAYNHIYDFADIHRLTADLQDHVARVGAEARVAPLRRTNEGWSISSESFLTADAQALLREFYRADFERFEFAEREATTDLPSSAASFVNELTDAIFDRNEMIIEHYQWACATVTTESERVRQIAELEEMVRYQPFGRDAGIRALENKVDGLRTMVVDKSKELEESRCSLDRAWAERDSLRRQCERLVQENAALRASTSWRIMEPLRRVVTLLRG